MQHAVATIFVVILGIGAVILVWQLALIAERRPRPIPPPVAARLAEIKAEVDRRAAIIGASGCSELPSYGRTSKDGAHVDVDRNGYHWVVMERGRELRRATTESLDDLLFHVFKSVTWELASQHARASRVNLQDPRRLYFDRQVQLLTQLSESWGMRCARENERILADRPFSDC